ncbi:MAG TPA: hypothetical protein VGK33_12655 [Chloroflexota bacterium]
MNRFEITELGQVSEQENMLNRVEAQSRRQARRDARGKNGPVVSAPWLATFLGMDRPSAATHHRHPHTAHESAGQ